MLEKNVLLLVMNMKLSNRRNRVDKISFEEWLKELTLLANQYYGDANLSSGDWIDFYNDDYTPEDALHEDLGSR